MGGASSGGTSSLVTAKKDIGERCTINDECGSTICADNVCCGSLCDGQCEACNLEPKGKCVIVPAGQPVGPNKVCANPSSVCGGSCTGNKGCTYPDSSKVCDSTTAGCYDPTTRQENALCDGAGACSSPARTACPLGQVCNVNTDGNCGQAVYTQLDMSDSHSCAVVSDGTLRCWGDNSYTQLGLLEGTSRRTVPMRVTARTNVQTVAAGWLFTCAVLRSGEVDCWGYNCNGELGCPYVETPWRFQTCTPIPPGSHAAEVVAGAEHACVRMSTGAVQCWGRNDRYEVGDGSVAAEIVGCGDVNANRFAPVNVLGIKTAQSITASWWNTCTVLIDGSLKCWGKNDAGQMGTGDTISYTIPTLALGLDGTQYSVIAGASGTEHSCAIVRDAPVMCFGQNEVGQLGDGTTKESLVPIPTLVPTAATSIAVGLSFSCAVINSTTVQCWGANYYGQLGNGLSVDSPTPVAPKLPAGLTFSKVVSKMNHACALSTTGRIWCWGNNDFGQLGIGTTVSSNVPVEIAPPDGT